MFKNWLKIAFINYKKNWLSTCINLFGLTIGLTGFMLILMHWNDEESYEKWNPKKDNIYFFQAYYDANKNYGNNISLPLAENAIKRLPEIEDYALLQGSGYSTKMIANGKSTYIDEGYRVSQNFFNVFPYKLVAGSYTNALNNESSIAISTKAAMSLFGRTNVAGSNINVDNKNYVVTAVFELPKENSQIKPNYVALAYEQLKNDEGQWGNFNYACFFLLKQGSDPQVVQEKFKNQILKLRSDIGSKEDGISPEEYQKKYGPNDVLLTPLTDIKLHAKASWFGNGDFKSILILFVLSVLIVVLSAINFINLKTAQASQRAKEVGIRKAIGSTKWSLVLQFLTETFIVCLAAFILALGLTELILPSFNKFLGKEMSMADPMIYVYSFGMMLVVSLISGIIPALYLSNFKAIETLKGNFARSKHGAWLRNGILSLQLIISSFFIIGGLIVNEQVKYMMNKDLGYNGKQIMMINFNESSPKPWLKYERLKTELAKIKGVDAVSYGEAVPGLYRTSTSNMDYLDKSIMGQHGSLDFDYLQFLGVKLKKGRWLSPNLASDTINNIIVNEAFVKEMGWTDDQAMKLYVRPGYDSIQYKIVGIVNDFNVRGLKNKVNPIVFFHYKETEWKRFQVYNVQVKINPNDIDGTVSRIKKYWDANVEPGYPIDYFFLDKKFAETYEKYQKQQSLFSVLNVMVLTVALLGLFALSSLMIEQKLKTVVIRKTLGASDSQLVMGLTKQFLIITFVAVLISVPISYYFMNEWLKDFAYRIEMPWIPYVLSLILLLILTFGVVSIKAYQATKVNLVKYLKYE
ncbi:FtsX-like permease family protein [Soonwooa sp.]|uniref:ABC transporter permease n=1 Tax=Soonwooa sp. TaxID=1938592 RepID=UPI002628AB8F|nr:FtsX-like permease family protein [Soonwooa sp.]